MRELRPNAHRQKGFTLVELLIVIVILGVLAAVVVLALGAFDQRGERAACETDVKAVEVAVEAFHAKEGHYPETLDELTEAPGNYLRQLPNTTPSSGDYWVTYDESTGQVGGQLQGGAVCAGDLLAAPSPTSPAPTTSSTTTPGGGGTGPGGGTTTTGGGGGTSTPPGGGTTTPTGGGTSTTPGGGGTTNPGPGTIGQPVLASQNCGLILCEVRIDWPSVSGNPSYWYQNVPRSNGHCSFGLGGSWVSGDSQESLLVVRGVTYCFRVQVIDGIFTGPWSPTLVYQAG